MMKDSEKEPFWWDTTGFEMNFVENMTQRRQQQGMSQSELAKKASERGLQFHQPTVQRIESGERPVKLTEAIEIALILGSDINAMMHSEGGASVRRFLTDHLQRNDFARRVGRFKEGEASIRIQMRDVEQWLKDLDGAIPEPGDDELRAAARTYLVICQELIEFDQRSADELARIVAKSEEHALLNIPSVSSY